MDAPL